MKSFVDLVQDALLLRYRDTLSHLLSLCDMPTETQLCFGYRVVSESLINAAENWKVMKKSLRFLRLVVLRLVKQAIISYAPSQQIRVQAGMLSFEQPKRASFADLPTEIFTLLKDAGMLCDIALSIKLTGNSLVYAMLRLADATLRWRLL